MRHEISQAEITAIRKAQAADAAKRKVEREQRELDEHQSRMEIRYKTQ
jgi:hypothetical protein